jgi:hypothetical protein
MQHSTFPVLSATVLSVRKEYSELSLNFLLIFFLQVDKETVKLLMDAEDKQQKCIKNTR